MGAPDDPWDDVAGEVAFALAFDLEASLHRYDADTVLMRVDARDDDPERVDVRKRFLRVFASERDFVRRVWAAVRPLLDGPRPVVVLFDVDQTLGSRKHRGDEAATLVRPSAVPLLRLLQEAGAGLGILTSRGAGLHRDLADALHLASIAGHLDERHLYVASPDLAGLPSSDAVDEGTFARFARLLDRDLAGFRALRDGRGRPLPAIDLAKLVQLAQVSQEHPDAVVVVVDDRDYAALLPGPDVVGVHLTPDERAHF